MVLPAKKARKARPNYQYTEHNVFEVSIIYFILFFKQTEKNKENQARLDSLKME